MDLRFQRQNTGDRPRYGAGGFARGVIGRARTEGNGQLGNKMSSSKIAFNHVNCNGSPVEGHLVDSEFQQNSSKKGSGASIKTLIHEEMSREKKVSRSSPSVIAKLMGLDSLPPPQLASKQQKDTKTSFPKTTYTSYRNHSLEVSTSEHQEFKDVFEIKDSIRVENHKKQLVSEGRPKQNETDVAFIRQKFMEAKRLSTDESLQNSKEFNDALEVLDSNKDLFLKFLEEPNPLFTMHLHDLNGFSPAPHESHITVLRSSKGKTHEIDDASCKSEVKAGGCTQMQKDAISTLRKPNTNLFNHLLKEHSSSLSHKLMKSRHAGKTNSVRSTKIVVLKPNLGKAQDMARSASQPRSHENYPFGYRGDREFQQSGIQELHAVGRERQNLFDNVEVTGQKIKGSREIAREITKQMKRSVSGGSEKMLVSGFNRHNKDGNLCEPPGMYSSKNSGAYQRSPDNFDYWSRASSPSSSSSPESFVSREARKRLSERWRMTNRLQEARFAGRGPSTLGEMLATDREARRDILDPVTVQKFSHNELSRGVLGTSGISSRDDWRGECSTTLPRSSSLPASSTVRGAQKSSRPRVSDGDSCYMLKDVLNLGVVDASHGNLNQRRSSSRKSSKLRNYKSQLNPGGEENKLPVRESHVNQEELRNGTNVSDPSETKPMLSQLSTSNIAHSINLINYSSDTELMNAEMPSISSEGIFQQPVQKEESSGINHIDEVIKEESLDLPVDSVPAQCSGTGSEFLTCSKDVEKPSPVSVLEHASEEGGSSPECFERVNAGLHDLRMQLQLLRLESDKYNSECETSVLSEDGTGEYNSPPQNGETLQTYRNEEDRDYSYLLDVLIDLGIHGAREDTCCSPKCPVDMDVFDKLEEKYGLLVGWSKLERKLFFDLISSILAETLSPWMGQQPWVKPKRKLGSVWSCEGLPEEVWQMVVRQRKELCQVKPEDMILVPRWLDLGEDLDMVGREIEGMLTDKLLEELVFEVFLD